MADGLIGIIGGTGLGDALAQHITGPSKETLDTPFGAPSSPVLTGTIGAKKIAFIARHGPGHTLSPTEVPYAANIFALKTLGATTLIASGAVGSLQEKIAPKDLVLVDQFIDKTSKRQTSFFAQMAAVHCEFANPCCNRLRAAILDAAKNIDAVTHDRGTYLCMEGPQFSTRAESIMHRQWGADLIGMTALPEAKLAREAQMCYALIALASDYDCWKPHDPSIGKHALLEEIIGNLTAATNNAIELIKAVLQSPADLCDNNCQCRKSLELAIWTNPAALNKEQKEKLKCLFE